MRGRTQREPPGEIRFHTEMVERATKAVNEAARNGAMGMEIAIAVLEAIREPTEAMVEAGLCEAGTKDNRFQDDKDAVQCAWRAMVAVMLAE